MNTMADIVSREDIRRLETAIKQMSQEQLKKTPVLYINELRRLAKAINREFGDVML